MPSAPTSRRERLAGFIILLALVSFAGIIVLNHDKIRQSRLAPTNESTSAASDSVQISKFAPVGFKSSGKLEQFNALTLSDKIDGKAELYLSSGFKSLACQRFESTQGSDPWFEWFIYDMGDARNAFAVFSLQRRPGAAASRVTELAYVGPNAVFIAHGRWYMEMIASVSDPAVVAALELSARHFIEAHPAGEARLEELALFPSSGQVAGSFTLHPSDVFGWDGLKNAFTMDYQISGNAITAFAGLQKGPDEAATLANGYANFLTFNGFTPWTPNGGWPAGFAGYQAFGMYEVVFHRGRVMGGIHECGSAQDAVAFARQWADQMTTAPFDKSSKASAP